MFSSRGGHLTNAMYHHGKTLINLLHHDETKKRAHDSQLVRAKENLKLSHGACADISSGARGLKLGLKLHLHPYFVYASSEGSGDTMKMRRLT